MALAPSVWAQGEGEADVESGTVNRSSEIEGVSELWRRGNGAVGAIGAICGKDGGLDCGSDNVFRQEISVSCIRSTVAPRVQKLLTI